MLKLDDRKYKAAIEYVVELSSNRKNVFLQYVTTKVYNYVILYLR